MRIQGVDALENKEDGMGYATDLRDHEWEILEPRLEPKQQGRPRKHGRREICDAIRYVQRTGCQWRMLPSDFPPWIVVYMTFWRWRHRGLWEGSMHELRRRVRVKAGRPPAPSLAIIDSQSVQTVQQGGNAGTTAATKRRDASAISRSM
jgi:putative transposase